MYSCIGDAGRNSETNFPCLCILFQAQAPAFASARAPVIIHRERSRATMAASASSAREDERSHSSPAESAAEKCANDDSNSELQAGKQTAPNDTQTAVAANKSQKKRRGQGKPVDGALKESALRKELLDARVRREDVKEIAKVESKAVKNAARKIERIKQKAKALSNNDLMEVYMMRAAEEEAKKLTQSRASKKNEAK